MLTLLVRLHSEICWQIVQKAYETYLGFQLGSYDSAVLRGSWDRWEIYPFWKLEANEVYMLYGLSSHNSALAQDTERDGQICKKKKERLSYY